MSGIALNAAFVALIFLIFCLTAVAIIARRQNIIHSRNQDSPASRHLYVGSLDLSDLSEHTQKDAAPAEEAD